VITKVLVQCTSGHIPIGFVADLKEVIERHKVGGATISFLCQDSVTITTGVGSSVGQRGACFAATHQQ